MIFDKIFLRKILLKIPRSKIISGHRSNTHSIVLDLHNLAIINDVIATVSGEVPNVKI